MSSLVNPVKKKSNEDSATLLCSDCKCSLMHVVINRESPDVVQISCSKCSKLVTILCFPEEN